MRRYAHLFVTKKPTDLFSFYGDIYQSMSSTEKYNLSLTLSMLWRVLPVGPRWDSDSTRQQSPKQDDKNISEMPELRDSLMEIFIPFPLYLSVEQLFVSKTKQKKKKKKNQRQTTSRTHRNLCCNLVATFRTPSV